MVRAALAGSMGIDIQPSCHRGPRLQPAPDLEITELGCRGHWATQGRLQQSRLCTRLFLLPKGSTEEEDRLSRGESVKHQLQASL